MSLADELLEVASSLIGPPRSRPRQAAIRRAISTAYYALFHRMIDAFVSRVLSGESHQAVVARMFDHGSMKLLCQKVQRLGDLPKQPEQSNVQLYPISTLIWPISENLKQIATGFTILQERRHQADYNRVAKYTRRDAEEMLKLARDSCEAVAIVEKSPEGQAFLLLLLLGEPKAR